MGLTVSDELDDLLRCAMSQAAETIGSAEARLDRRTGGLGEPGGPAGGAGGGPGEATRLALVAALARRRQRRRARLAGGLAILALAATGTAVALPTVFTHPVARRVVVGAGPAPTPSRPAPTKALHVAANGGTAGALGGLGAARKYSTGGTSAAPLLAVPGGAVVTQADQGSTLTLRVGQSLVVKLTGSPSFRWSQPVSTAATVLGRQSGSADPTTGNSYAVFRALSRGRASIGAAQAPLCTTSRPACEIASRSWNVSVDVSS